MRAAAPCALALALVASAVALAGGADVRVAPGSGGTHRAFAVAFTAPGPSGADGLRERSYSVAAHGPRGRGCRSARSVPATAGRAGERVRVALRVAAGERWCRGRFRGHVTMTEGPHCERGQPCPLFPTRLVELGRFAFRVR